MSVDICKTGYCQGCKYVDLEISQVNFWYNHEVHTKDTVSCKHKQACERMEGIMTQQRDYILHNGVRHIPIKSVNDVEMELTSELVKTAIRKAYDPEVILTIKKGEDDERMEESEE